MTLHPAQSAIPPLVQQAQALAQQLAFTHSSLPEVGRLLAVLTAALPHGRIAEIGSGCGVGTAWMASYLHPQAILVTIDTDREYARAVQRLLSDDQRIKILHGDWRELTPYGPFHLLFADGGQAKIEDPDALIALVTLGGIVVLDDLTVEEYWPESWKGQADPVRQFWLNTTRLVATEIRITERDAVIVATRIK